MITFPEPKNNDWRPNASLLNLKTRAEVLGNIRTFFKERNVLEVETPLLCATAVSDPHIHAIRAEMGYLQTSPEFSMKRLLAAGIGSIYQICKAFRREEMGRFHNPEFTILEWYREGFDHHALMDEVDDFLMTILNSPKAERLTYQRVFERFLGINPHTATLSELKMLAIEKAIAIPIEQTITLTIDDWLDILMSHTIEPKLGFDAPVMITDYPASKAALAKIRLGEYPVAERFEVYIQGIELANGYHELTDANVQLDRYKQDCLVRGSLQYPMIPLDKRLIEALEYGLPACAGIALGIDRLIMLKLKAETIEDVLTFTSDRA